MGSGLFGIFSYNLCILLLVVVLLGSLLVCYFSQELAHFQVDLDNHSTSIRTLGEFCINMDQNIKRMDHNLTLQHIMVQELQSNTEYDYSPTMPLDYFDPLNKLPFTDIDCIIKRESDESDLIDVSDCGMDDDCDDDCDDDKSKALVICEDDGDVTFVVADVDNITNVDDIIEDDAVTNIKSVVYDVADIIFDPLEVKDDDHEVSENTSAQQEFLNMFIKGQQQHHQQIHDTDYRKMSVNKLRTIVTEKELSSDASKLKKIELVKLLESSLSSSASASASA